MELFTDLKSRLAFRSGGKPEQEDRGPWERLVESGRALMATIERSGKIREANEAVCRLREEDHSDLLETSLLYLVHAEDRNHFAELVREVFGGSPGGEVRGRFLAAEDQKPEVHWILFPTVDRDGTAQTVTCLGVNLGVDAGRAQEGQELASLRKAVAKLERDKLDLQKAQAQLEKKLAEKPAAALPVDPGPIPGLEDDGPTPTLAELERRYILHVLEQTKGRISGAKGAAAVLGLHPNTLRSRMGKHGIGKGA